MDITNNKTKTTIPRIELAVGRAFPKKVIPLINGARKTIEILVFDWGWYENEIGEQIQIFNNAIVRAQQRGVSVKAIVYKQKIKNILDQQKIWARKLDSSKLMHVKLMMIDHETVIVGSHNYTKNAFNLNYELSLIIHDTGTAEKIRSDFEPFFL